MKFEVELTKIEPGSPLVPKWAGENKETIWWSAVVSAGGHVARGETRCDMGAAIATGVEGLTHKIAEAALAGPQDAKLCSCGSILAADPTRHFRGCAMREVYPTYPLSPSWGAGRRVVMLQDHPLTINPPVLKGMKGTVAMEGLGMFNVLFDGMSDPNFQVQFNLSQWLVLVGPDSELEIHRDTEPPPSEGPPVDPRVGEIHGDDMCSEAVGGAHDWQPAASLQRAPGDTRPDHEAERMGLAVWLQCGNCGCSAWSEYAEGYPREEPSVSDILRVKSIAIGDISQANSAEALQAGNLIIPIEVQLEEPESIRPPEVTC